MSKQISIPDRLYERVCEQAKETAVPVETLVAHLLEHALSQPSYRALIETVTQAYARGQTTPSAGSWSRVEAELAATESPFESLEAAMTYSRGRT